MTPALARVHRVIAAGRRIADPRDPLGREARERLPTTTGLSPASVEIALRDHLETDPSPHDLATLLARATPAPRCHAVLSANVCTAALRALAVATATSPAVFVKPSRRDPVLAELLARALAEDPTFAAASGTLTLVAAISPTPGDEVHVYGSDETIATIAATLPHGTTLRAHGAGFGVAIIEASADAAQATAALALDIAAFDQRGCLSPRVLLVAGDASRAATIAHALARDLADLASARPRGLLDPATRAELRRYVATAQALGACHEGDGFVVGLDESPTTLVLPPAARAIHVMPATPDRATAWLRPWTTKLAALGTAGHGPLIAAAQTLAPNARLSLLGAMQRPPLDGPVDLRVLEIEN